MALQDEAKELIDAAWIKGALDMLNALLEACNEDLSITDALMEDNGLRKLAGAIPIPYAVLLLELNRGSTEDMGPRDIDELEAASVAKRIIWERYAKGNEATA